MPHILVEYPSTAMNRPQVASMLAAIHQSITQSGLYSAEQIRARAHGFDHFTNAGGSEPFIHIVARIKSGRDENDKKQLVESILNSFTTINIPISIITAEIVDMDRNTYGKFSV